jgi:hypothetical protein
VADRVHTAEKRVQPPGLERSSDRPRRQAELDELTPADHPMLPRSQLRYGLLPNTVHNP